MVDQKIMSPRSGRQLLAIIETLTSVTRFAGFDSLTTVTWRSASLRPRLYAFACSAGLLIQLTTRSSKNFFSCFGHVCIRQSAHDSFAARTIVLQRATIAHRIVEAKLVNDSFQIIEPEL